MSKELVGSIINKCKLLLDKITYLEKMNDNQRPTSGLSPQNFEEAQEADKILVMYIDKVRKRKVKVKAYFMLMIFDLVHLMHLNIDLEKIANQMSLSTSVLRIRRKSTENVCNMKDLIFFFRDAIAHPEEKNGELSPRRSVKYNFDVSDTFMNGTYDVSINDVFYQIGDCRISFNEIKSLLKAFEKHT